MLVKVAVPRSVEDDAENVARLAGVSRCTGVGDPRRGWVLAST